MSGPRAGLGWVHNYTNKWEGVAAAAATTLMELRSLAILQIRRLAKCSIAHMLTFDSVLIARQSVATLTQIARVCIARASLRRSPSIIGRSLMCRLRARL